MLDKEKIQVGLSTKYDFSIEYILETKPRNTNTQRGIFYSHIKDSSAKQEIAKIEPEIKNDILNQMKKKGFKGDDFELDTNIRSNEEKITVTFSTSFTK